MLSIERWHKVQEHGGRNMKFRKILISILSVASILSGSITSTISVMAADSQLVEIDDVEVTAGQLADGVTIVLTKNEEGIFEQTVYYDIDFSSIPQPTATADGELEWAVFHLGFNNWNDDTGRLYFTISADEPMSKVTGNAYVKSTSWLFPETFYSDSFSKKLSGSMNTSRTLKEKVDTGDEEKVRVGFSSVVLLTTADEKGYFSDTSQVVER